MLNWYRADLHVHTVLSPCGELEMGPREVTAQCQRLGIQILGITDHNKGSNVPAFLEAGKERGITVLPGLEIQTREEVHLLGLFPQLFHLASFEEEYRLTLPHIQNKEEVFGSQIVVNAEEEILGLEESLLLVSSSLGIYEVVELIRSHGGMVIPSHIERQAYGILVNLGFLPPDMGFLALELGDYSRKEELTARFPDLLTYPLLASSDAHTLEDMDGEWVTYFYVQVPCFQELKKALEGLSQRKVVVLPKHQLPE